MQSAPRLTIGEALFGDLPDEVATRYGVTAPDRNTSIRQRKLQTEPGAKEGAPSSPWHLSRSSWMEAGKRVIHEIGADRVTSVSGGVTFFTLLALFPAITALVSIYGLFADSETIVGTVGMLQRFLPQGALDLIRGQIEAIAQTSSSSLGIASIVGLLTALWTANGGIKSLISALNVAWFETETRGLVRLNLVSLAFTLGGIVLICAMLASIAILPWIIDLLPLGDFGAKLVSFLRWPLMFVVLMGALAALYRWGPDKEGNRWHWISPGALFATIGLIIASILFSWYAANFANYNETYGSLGAVIGLMMWLWIASMVVMVGAEINSALERQVQVENGIPLEDESAKRPDAAPSDEA